MNTRYGFSIIECLVYCSLFCMVCILIFGWVGASQISLVQKSRQSCHFLDIYGSLDIFVQDAMGCPSDEAHWKKMNEHEIIWQANDEDIGWFWRDGSLYRTTGIYKNQKWAHASKSLVSNSIPLVLFSTHRNTRNEIMQVSCNFDGVLRIIALRNRSFDGKE